MSLKPILDSLFKTPEAQDSLNFIRKFVSKSSSVLEFGCRGGITGIACLQGLMDGRNFAVPWKPRYVGIDLMNDESCHNLQEIAKKMEISFQFLQIHSKDYPVHETDLFIWDSFHSGGNLLRDINRVEPYVQKYILVVGMKTFGLNSENKLRNLNSTEVAKELDVPVTEVDLNLKEAVAKFLSVNSDWFMIQENHEIVALGRKTPAKTLFA
jgi:hypothetical protein